VQMLRHFIGKCFILSRMKGPSSESRPIDWDGPFRVARRGSHSCAFAERDRGTRRHARSWYTTSRSRRAGPLPGKDFCVVEASSPVSEIHDQAPADDVQIESQAFFGSLRFKEVLPVVRSLEPQGAAVAAVDDEAIRVNHNSPGGALEVHFRGCEWLAHEDAGLGEDAGFPSVVASH
jgi:hypothetical protein